MAPYLEIGLGNIIVETRIVLSNWKKESKTGMKNITDFTSSPDSDLDDLSISTATGLPASHEAGDQSGTPNEPVENIKLPLQMRLKVARLARKYRQGDSDEEEDDWDAEDFLRLHHISDLPGSEVGGIFHDNATSTSEKRTDSQVSSEEYDGQNLDELIDGDEGSGIRISLQRQKARARLELQKRLLLAIAFLISGAACILFWQFLTDSEWLGVPLYVWGGILAVCVFTWYASRLIQGLFIAIVRKVFDQQAFLGRALS